MNIKTDPLTAARAEALFTSRLATGSRPAHDVADEAIRLAVRARGGARGCAAEVAAEYGDHRSSRFRGCSGRVAWSNTCTAFARRTWSAHDATAGPSSPDRWHLHRPWCA